MAMKILIVEDDALVAKSLKKILGSHYVVDHVGKGQAVLEDVDITHYDLMILDLGLPDVPGLQVCQQVRQLGYQGGILVLTANWHISDIVRLLDAGADDYLTKPFNAAELKARLRAIKRRNAKELANNTLRVGELELDPVGRRVWRRQHEIKLRRKEFDLLEYLMRHSGQTVTRNMIINQIWDMDADVWTNAVDVHVKYLRDKVDKPFKKPLITTIHGVGYRLET